MWTGPATISNVMLLEAQTASLSHRVVLLACVVMVDLASYVTVALGTSGAKWMNLLAEKIMTRMMGLLPAALAVQFLFNGMKGEQGLLGR
jgi:multiple antibiotic resistance protein